MKVGTLVRLQDEMSCDQTIKLFLGKIATVDRLADGGNRYILRDIESGEIIVNGAGIDCHFHRGDFDMIPVPELAKLKCQGVL